jgi:hypothetical protein
MKNLIRISIFLTLSLTLAALCNDASAADTFDASPVVHVTRERPSPASGNSTRSGAQARLRPGEIQAIYTAPRGSSPQMAFYLPQEGVRYIQLIIEKRGSEVTYFAKGLRRGRTVGGAVEREWLDSSGFSPRSITDEARIQQALKRNPFYIEVY